MPPPTPPPWTIEVLQNTNACVSSHTNGNRMGGLARLLDEMTADPFWATPGPSSLWKRLDMSAPAMAASLKLDVKEVRDVMV